MSATNKSAPLAFSCDNTAVTRESVSTILQTLTRAQVSPLDLLTEIFTCDDELVQECRDELLGNTQAISRLFDAFLSSDGGRKTITTRALDIVLKTIDSETRVLVSQSHNDPIKFPILLGHAIIRSTPTPTPILSAILSQVNVSVESECALRSDQWCHSLDSKVSPMAEICTDETNHENRREALNAINLASLNKNDANDEPALNNNHPATNVDISAKVDPSINQHIKGSSPLPTPDFWDVSRQRTSQVEHGSENQAVMLDALAIDMITKMDTESEDVSGHGRRSPPMPLIASRETGEVIRGHFQVPFASDASTVIEDRPPRRTRRPSKKRAAQLALQANQAPTSNLDTTFTTSKRTSLSRSALMPFGNQSTTSGNLRSHTYACSVCPKRFPKHQALRDHMNTHAGVKPYACPNPSCPRTYSNQKSVGNHIRTCSPKKGYHYTRES